MIVGGGFAIAATVASLANPIAGVIVQALGALADLVMSESAVGYFHCPYPLTRRSAGAGECDFSQTLGQDALERAQRQAQGVPGYFVARQPTTPQAAAAAAGGIPQWALIAGGVAVAAGVGYYLLKE